MQQTAPTQQGRLTDQYDAAAPKWQAKIENIGYPAAYRYLIEQARDHQGLALVNVLDAGAGCGDFAKALVDVVGVPDRLELLDISSEMLLKARSHLSPQVANIHTHNASVEDFQPKDPFDIILCAHVIEHCADDRVALTVLREALKPDGALLLIASKPHWCTSLLRLIWRHKSYRPAHMEALLQSAGFKQVTVFRFPVGPPSRTSCGYLARP